MHVTDLLLLEELHAHLPVGLLVNDADTLEILHANPPLGLCALTANEAVPPALTVTLAGDERIIGVLIS